MSTEFDLGLDGFQANPYYLIKTLVMKIKALLYAFNCGGYDLSDLAISTAAWAILHPGGQLRCPPYIPVTAGMTSPQSKAATENNIIHTAIMRAQEGVKGSLIKTIGETLANDIMDNPDVGLRLEPLGDIIEKLVNLFDRPSPAFLGATVANLSVYDKSVSLLVNFSNFKRKLAFLVSHKRLTGSGDAITHIYDLMESAGNPYTSILLDWKKLHTDLNWADRAGGTYNLADFYTFFNTQVLAYPASAHSNFSVSGMSYHTASTAPILDKDLASLHAKIQSLTDKIANFSTSGGGSKHPYVPKLDRTWVTAQKEPAGWVMGAGQTGTHRKYCYKCGYDQHHGWMCWGMHNLAEFTIEMKKATSDSTTLLGSNKKPISPSILKK